MSKQTVKVIDNNSGEVLFHCSLDQIERAYREASNFESYGLDVKIVAPTLTETLANSLGIKGKLLDVYQESVIAEIHDHEGCCSVNNKDNI